MTGPSAIRRRALGLIVLAPAVVRAAPGATDDPAIAAAADRALALRDEAVRRGDQPYGAVVVRDGRIVRVALRDAAARLGTDDLSGCVLVGSARACSACATAAHRARIARLWHGRPPIDDGPPRPSA